MDIEKLLLENNAMLKVIMEQQSYLTVVLDSILVNVDTSSVDEKTADALTAMRQQMAMIQLEKSMLQVKKKVLQTRNNS